MNIRIFQIVFFLFSGIGMVCAQTSKRDDSNLLVNAGIQKFSQNDFNGAITDFTRAINTDPENPLAWYNRGMSKYHLKDYFGSINDCNKAVEINPKDANPYNIRGLVYAATGDQKSAMKDFNKAIQLAPESYLGFFNRGILYEQMKDFKNALKDYSKSISMNLENIQGYQNRGVVYFQMGLYKEAIADYSQALYMSPDNTALYYNRGVARMEGADYLNAIGDYEKVIELDPKNSTAYYNMGVCYNSTGNRNKACWAMDRAFQLGNDQAKISMEKLNCSGTVGIRDGAGVEVDRTIKTASNILEKVETSESEIRKYLNGNLNKLNPVEGIWSANINTVRGDESKTEEPNFGRVAIIRDTVNASRDFIMIFLDGKKYFPNTIIADFTRTSYQNVYITQTYSLDGLKDAWNFTIDDVGILSGKKNVQEGSIQVYKELFYVKIYPAASATTDGLSEKKEPSSGSGFFIDKKGILVTNAHVVVGYSSIKIEMLELDGTKKIYPVKILLKDETNDIALLKIDDPSFKPLNNVPYGIDEFFSVGEKVFALGYPLSHIMGTELKVTNGIISSKSGAKDDIRYMQISAPLQPGNSGGPVFNGNGNVIGIASARLTGETQNVSYAMKSIYLNNIVKMSSEMIDTAKKPFLKDLPLEKQIDILKYFICLIHSE